MRDPKRILTGLLLLVAELTLPLAVSGQGLTDSTNVSVNLVVPDGNPIGLTSTVTVSTPIQALKNLQVALEITNGWNGDLHAYLAHDSGFVVLLNRSGRSQARPFGYDDLGFNVTLDGAATTNVHTYRLALFGNENTPLGGPLTSTWAPDGRNANPATVSSTNTVDTFLSSFNELNPNGRWTLFIADLAAGDVSTLVSWGLQMSGTSAAPAITITAQPANTTAECGGSATFSVTATGTEPLHYQWHFGATPVGINSSNLVLNSVSAANDGSYSVVITNGSGSITSELATLTVQDTLAPVVNWSFTNLTLTADSDCQALMPDVTGTNYILAADVCSSMLTITQTPTNNALLALGTNEVVLAVADGNGNTAYSTNTVVVADQTAPVITVLGDNPLTNECHAAFVDPGATGLDNCSGGVSVSTNGTVNANAVGVYAIEYVASDTAGNTATNSRQVYVVDTTAPAITACAPAQIVTAGYNGIATLSNLTTLVIASDACSGSVHITQQPPAGTGIAVGATNVVFYVDDGNGNTNTCSSTVTVNAAPLVPPTILSEQVLGDGSFQLTFSGPEGQPYQVLASPDVAAPLGGWPALTNGHFDASPATFADNGSTNYPARFYRVVSP